jgi:translation initiation factor 1
VKIRREVRRGKPTTVVWDLPVGEAEARKVLKELQRSCGAGGSWKDGQLELQGDHREKVEQLCQQRGWKSKRAGG